MSDIFNDKNEIKSTWVKWGKIGDFITGTLVDVREINSQLPGKEGERVKVYEIKAESGQFHELDKEKQPLKEPVILNKDEIWAVGGRQGIDAQMRRIKIGQKLGMKFTDEKPARTKGFNALKIIKVYTTGVMDTEWLESEEAMTKDIV